MECQNCQCFHQKIFQKCLDQGVNLGFGVTQGMLMEIGVGERNKVEVGVGGLGIGWGKMMDWGECSSGWGDTKGVQWVELFRLGDICWGVCLGNGIGVDRREKFWRERVELDGVGEEGDSECVNDVPG